MADPVLGQYRQQVLADAVGDVLEIGFGTGLNLAYYPDRVQSLTTVDPNPGMNRWARKRIEQSPLRIEQRVLSGESLPMADSRFDTVVSTWTLCSIPQVEQAVQEVYRVLKPGGQFLFVEHGLSADRAIQVWQHRLTPLQKRIADGCHFNRNMRQLIENQFETVAIESFYADNLPKVTGYFYKGKATKAVMEN